MDMNTRPLNIIFIRDPVVLNAEFWTENEKETTKLPVCSAMTKTLRMLCCHDLRCSSKSWIYTKNNSNARTNLPTMVHLRSFIGCPFFMLFHEHRQNIYLLKQATACVCNRASPCTDTKCIAARRLIHIPLNTKDIWVSGYV